MMHLAIHGPGYRARLRAVRALFAVPPTGGELRTLLRHVRDVPASDAGALRAALLALGVRPARLAGPFQTNGCQGDGRTVPGVRTAGLNHGGTATLYVPDDCRP